MRNRVGSIRLPLPAVEKLERLAKCRVIVYCMGDPPLRSIAASDADIMRQCLESDIPPCDRISLILNTDGGLLSAAHRIAYMLRARCKRLTVYVPHKARSAGTFLCLAANEVAMGSLAELSPLDPVVRANQQTAKDSPTTVSSEDIRNYRTMAESWFGLKGQRERLHIFQTVCDRFFPTALTAFFRAERYSRRIAEELLAYQLPDMRAKQRQAIIEKLITTYPEHQHSLNWEEALSLGLRARVFTRQEEALVTEIWATCQSLQSPVSEAIPSTLLFSRTFSASFLMQRISKPAELSSDDPSNRTPGRLLVSSGAWKVHTVRPRKNKFISNERGGHHD